MYVVAASNPPECHPMIRVIAVRRISPWLGVAFPFLAGCGGEKSTQPNRAVALAVVTQPSASAQSGVALGQAPVVELRDHKPPC